MVKKEDAHWSGVLDPNQVKYHLNQYDHPYRSTVKMIKMMEKEILNISDDLIIDVACGSGANAQLMQKQWQNKIIGIDINEELIKLGKTKVEENILLLTMDFANIKKLLNIPKVQEKASENKLGITCYQTLSWMSDWKSCLTHLISVSPKWVCLNSLFYDGPLNYEIKVTDYTTTGDKVFYYNVYSIPEIKKFLEANGYEVIFQKFEIDIDLPKPNDKGSGTYTVDSSEGKLQFSGSLYLPWYNLLAQKRDHK